MDDILQSIGDAIHDFFVDVCGGMFIGIFDDANAATGDIASQVGLQCQQLKRNWHLPRKKIK